MSLTIRERADTIGTFRSVSVRLMETLARWIPTTPELDVKVLFGRHVWEMAQHADWLGRRTAELRAPLHFDRAPADAYGQVLERLAEAADTAARVAGFYDAVLPDVEARYRRYRHETDLLLDEPSVRVIDRILSDLERLRREREALRALEPQFALGDPEWPHRLAVAAANGDFVAYRPAQPASQPT